MQIEKSILSLELSEVEYMLRAEGKIDEDAIEDAIYLYRVFLQLKKIYPKEDIIPTEIVDIIWHYHILHTQKYAIDCDRIFGEFIHHHPSLSFDSKVRVELGKGRTLNLIKKHFPELYYD